MLLLFLFENDVDLSKKCRSFSKKHNVSPFIGYKAILFEQTETTLIYKMSKGVDSRKISQNIKRKLFRKDA